MGPQITPELYRIPDVCAALGIGRSSLYTLLETDPTFPRPVRVATRAVRWRRIEIERWARELPEAVPVMPRGRTP